MILKARRSSAIQSSFRVEQVRGMFDVATIPELVTEWNIDFPIEANPDWKIGLIYGPSGCGKTTLSQAAFPDAYHHSRFDWPESGSFLDGFDKETSGKEITSTLNSVGFSSPPHWLKPFSHLSNGQKFRCELARCLLLKEKVVVFDEFTSVVDRDVAKICSAAVAKTIRRKKEPQLVAVSCHSDISEWLQPDWILDVGANRFEWRCLCRRPEIKSEIFETTVSAWNMFKGHHYLSASINKTAKCYVAEWNGRPVGFASVLHFPHPKEPKFKRGHRTVVLPDFQGVGIGNALSEAVAEMYVEKGFRFISATSHPSMIGHRVKSKKWKLTSLPKRMSADSKTIEPSLRKTMAGTRMVVSFEFKKPEQA
jgi:energy-coupling factor transporter ATP-binding protein EcfA2